MKLNRIHFARSFLFGLFSVFMASSQADTGTYTFSVVPQFKPAQLQKEWSPLLERLSRETGYKFKLVLAPNIPKFQDEISKGAPDFALANPYQAALAVKESGYIPMLRDKKPLNGILVVRKDSNYKKLTDLNGATIGFPAPNALAASLYMRALLTEDRQVKFTPKYLKNHNLVFRHVLLGHVAAGGTVNSALKDEPQDVQDQLTVLYKTPDVAPHPIMAHPRVPESVRKSVTNALLAMQNDVEGRAILTEIRMPNLVDANYKIDYQPIEKLNIQKYLVDETD
jgi:phosphonate transport system substrate-binding protein